MGSSEVAEGLTAIYQFEHNIDSATAGLGGGGRHSYVGLEGGFGKLRIGKFWNAAYNTFGGMIYNAWFMGNTETTYNEGQYTFVFSRR